MIQGGEIAVLHAYRKEWSGNIQGDVLAGIVVALALIPEAIAFSIIAGLDPMVGLYASFVIAVVIAFVGGRPGMISAATGAMALLMVNLVADHGLSYLLAATVLTGVIQILFGLARLARYMKFIPRSVMVGFVNALAILIFLNMISLQSQITTIDMSHFNLKLTICKRCVKSCIDHESLF